MTLDRVIPVVPMLASILICTAASAQVHRYLRWLGEERVTIEEPPGETSEGRGRIVVGNDAIFQTDFCNREGEFYCFFSAHHAFAVPKVLDPDTHQWKVRGVRFELIARDVSLSILGKNVNDLLVIRSPADAAITGGKAWIYLYSSRHGLVAFGSEDLRGTYWIQDEAGFGAAPRSRDFPDSP